MTHALSGCGCTRGWNRLAKRRGRWGRRRDFVEGLERRRLLAAVSWDGGGDGINWTDSNNWSGNALPGPADDVTISVGASPTVLIPSGTQTVRSLVSDELIRTTGGTLAVSMTAQASQSVTLASGGLSGGAWTFSAGAAIVGTASGGTLANVAIGGGDLLLNTTSATVLLGGTTSFPRPASRPLRLSNWRPATSSTPSSSPKARPLDNATSPSRPAGPAPSPSPRRASSVSPPVAAGTSRSRTAPSRRW